MRGSIAIVSIVAQPVGCAGNVVALFPSLDAAKAEDTVYRAAMTSAGRLPQPRRIVWVDALISRGDYLRLTDKGFRWGPMTPSAESSAP